MAGFQVTGDTKADALEKRMTDLIDRHKDMHEKMMKETEKATGKSQTLEEAIMSGKPVSPQPTSAQPKEYPPNSSYVGTATDPKTKHRIGSNDGKSWYDVASGKKIL